MKRFALAVSILALGAVSASAADMAPYTKAPPMVDPGYDWSGFYIGVEGGGMWSKADNSFVFPPPATFSNSRTSGIAGGFVGVQKQWGKIVVGVEATGLGVFDQNLGRSACNPAAACGAGLLWGNRLDSGIFSVGPRLGFAAGMWMPYATGGYAATRQHSDLVNGAGTLLESYTNDRSGWYAGVGVDFAVQRNWIVGVEYRHYDFGTARGAPVTPGGVVVVGDSTDVSLKADTVAVRASYKFGWDGPVVARY